MDERVSKREVEVSLAKLLREEELKWALRAKVRQVVQGDNNTQFFHMIANGKHRKKRIIQLEQDEGTIVGHENLKMYITNYYKNLFGAPAENYVALDESMVDDIPQLRDEENEVITAPFSEKEDLFNGHLQLFKLNFGTITLLPKKAETAFMPGRHILEGVVVLHETLHEIHSKKLDGVVFKVDFEKAYDKVKWSFLQQALRMKGFDEAWRKQVESFVQGGSVGIKVNDDIGQYFQTLKGLRQGDPMSPILFNVVVDMLAVLVNRAKQDGQVGGLIPHLVEGGVPILQYADDTIIFMEHDLVKARNMKHETDVCDARLLPPGPLVGGTLAILSHSNSKPSPASFVVAAVAHFPVALPAAGAATSPYNAATSHDAATAVPPSGIRKLPIPTP
ncbi:uncharacterized protein [Aegilops tauschii subsp. strangulata]|uniref:uncharacterized protein n=1 Tax=Aegilops tauschii subsp. strangulata TaxID=200361 RepID=UPI003CC86646